MVITRKKSEQILLGDDVVVTVLEVRGDKVRLGIEAPESVKILRGELAEAPQVTAGHHKSPEPDHADIE